jgi:hypothetical protein
MEELPKQPQNPENKVENEAEIRESQERAAQILQARFELYKDVPYKIYDDTINRGGYDEIEGYPRYYVFLKEADYLAQYALSNEVDAVLLWDTSARGVGLLLNKILPIIALEKAKREGKNPEEIKLPKILFYKPYVDNRTNVAKYIESLGVKKVLIFDEGSHDSPDEPTLVQPDSSEPYRWKEAELVSSGKNDKYLQGRHSQTTSSTQHSSMQLEANIFKKYFFPNGQVEILDYLGGSGGKGGFDRDLRRQIEVGKTNFGRPIFKEEIPFQYQLSYGVFAPDKESVRQKLSKKYHEEEMFYNEYQEMFPVFSERNDKEKDVISVMEALHISREDAEKKLAEIRQQTRDEHSRMAWELFNQVILGNNPYKNN